jgi:metallo-beta-lactamase family protein
VDIAELSLSDAAHIQMEDARYRTRKKLSSHGVALPLFDTDDVKAVLGLFSPSPFGQWVSIDNGIRFRLHLAGHILGAACIELDLNDGSRRVSILFSGDIGRYGNPLTNNPAEPPRCDYLVCESTYGGRIHPPEDPDFSFANLLDRINAEKRILLIPAFSIGRTQQITFLVNRLMQRGRIDPIEIHIDSPMSVSATEIYARYPGLHALNPKELGGKGSILGGKHVKLHRKRKSSKLLNKLKGPAIIFSASGMLSGGRILHHLLNRLSRPETVLALVGFMAEGTLGRKIADGAETVYIHKTPVAVKAEIVKLSGLSGHADYYELLHWLEPIKEPPRMVFVTHGEPAQAEAMAGHLKAERNWPTAVPSMDETVELTSN